MVTGYITKYKNVGKQFGFLKGSSMPFFFCLVGCACLYLAILIGRQEQFALQTTTQLLCILAENNGSSYRQLQHSACISWQTRTVPPTDNTNTVRSHNPTAVLSSNLSSRIYVCRKTWNARRTEISGPHSDDAVDAGLLWNAVVLLGEGFPKFPKDHTVFIFVFKQCKRNKKKTRSFEMSGTHHQTSPMSHPKNLGIRNWRSKYWIVNESMIKKL